MSLAQRVFTETDQKRFASVSGDYNPMHMDAVQARRTQAGAPVVHGIHLFLWALESVAAAIPELPALRGFRVHFNKFVHVGERAEVAITKQSAKGAQLSLSSGGVPRSKITLTFGDAIEDYPDWAAASLEPVPFSPAALDLRFEEMPGRAGRLSFQMTGEDAAQLFPAATKWLGARRIAAIAASTQLVGMVCPGLHSVYSELSANVYAESDTDGSFAFRVTEADPRFRSVDLEFAGGGMTGTIYSSSRMPPVRQATMEEIAGLVDREEFAGSVALIVGGSRGLGELTAKLIASGGGRVLITWQSGKDDAEKVAGQIRAAGGSCETLAYDARKPADEQLAHLAEAPTHVYYFSTPPIFRPQAEIFSAARLQEFIAFYVEGFWQLAQTLRSRQPGLSLFYPSTVFVEERPDGMTEYTMAKAAGEALCAYMNKSQAPLHVTVIRLPRLPTDQTASVTASETASPVETMLPLIREVQSWPK
jgi:NAD(P)-dependent dehydrogenase (short-subunit alcohol dehydrogenase family)